MEQADAASVTQDARRRTDVGSRAMRRDPARRAETSVEAWLARLGRGYGAPIPAPLGASCPETIQRDTVLERVRPERRGWQAFLVDQIANGIA